MRSSIACARCRRSKVKCVNNGVNTTCRDCEAKGRECTYPTPTAGGGGGIPRRESSASKPLAEAAFSGETHRRQKIKKPSVTSNGNVSTKESMRALVDALDTSVLTPKVWIELFDIYQLHFSADLPFLHAPTFLKPLRQMTSSVPQSQDFGIAQQGTSPPNPLLPPAHPLLLLGFLTLTARFHPQLVAHHSPSSSTRPSNPLIASEYYAAALRARMTGTFGEGLGHPHLARAQALAMIAMHEWGNCEGAKAFISLGVAVRYAQLLGLQYQDDLDDEPQARSLAVSPNLSRSKGIDHEVAGLGSGDDGDAFIEQEIRRRTFWSCFILDRYLSSGKHRPQMLRISDLRLQLPSSDHAFLFGEKVRTPLLTEDLDDGEARAGIQASRRISLLLTESNGDAHHGAGHSACSPGSYRNQESGHDADESREVRWETGPNEGAVSRYIKAIELYGRIARWSCAGGRRREKFPPWDPQSQWYQLHKTLETFRERLPRDLALTQANVSAHLSAGTPTPYILLHTTLLLCGIVLHRDYIPFLPLRYAKPQGPLDPPLFPVEQYQIPSEWWEQSAKELFRSARELINLLQTCKEWNVLVVTPLVGFAVYTSAFVGVYSNHFPWMDQGGFLCKKSGSDDPRGADAARKAVEMLGHMRMILRMADGWLKTISHIHRYFKRIKKEFGRNTRHIDKPTGQPSPNDPNFPALQDGTFGGGLDEYKMFERTLRDFGSLDDEDTEMVDASEYDSGRAASSVASVAIKSEGMKMQEGSPDSAAARTDRWRAINNSTTTAQAVEPTANGAVHYQAPAMPAGTTASSQPNAPLSNPYPTASNHTSPLVSPGQGNFATYPPHQTVSHGHTQLLPIHAQAQAVPPPLPQPLWTAEMRDAWLSNLDTTFSGDDIAAFVEGRVPSSPGPEGWLSTVWAGYSHTV